MKIAPFSTSPSLVKPSPPETAKSSRLKPTLSNLPISSFESNISAEMLWPPKDGRKRFRVLLGWVGERPEVRESLVKTGWRSWREKWRDTAFRIARK